MKRWQTVIIISLAIFYILAGSFAAYKYQHTPDENLFDISFCYGSYIESIVTNNTYASGAFKAHRTPFIPLFLSAIAIIYNNLLFAYLAKNFLTFSLIFMCMYIAWKSARNVNKYILALIAAYALSFPQLVLHGFAIDYGEGYLITFMTLLFVGILHAKEIRKGPIFLALAFVNSLMFLTKGSMIFLPIAVCFFYYWVTENRRVFLTFLSVLLVTFAMWGSFNLYNSGKFTILYSYSGLNFYKGNNELALSIYPNRSLDLLTDKVARGATEGSPEHHNKNMRPRGAPGGGETDEWDRDKYYTKKAFKFIKNHPLEATRLFLLKAYVMFFRITNVADENEGRYPILKYLGMAYMFIFRVIFLGCLLSAAKSVFFRKDKIAAVYIGFILVYSIPCLAGFAYERHVMPLIGVTLFYLVSILSKERQIS